VVAAIARTLDAVINVQTTGYESIAEALGVQVTPLPIDMIKTADDNNHASIYQVILDSRD
jgi:hypothetical protein